MQSPNLLNRGYLSLLAVQFLNAVNDNLLKQIITFMVATGMWAGSWEEGGLGEGGQSVTALCLTLPFIVLSGFAGQLADRFSKQRVILSVKFAEIPIAFLALAGMVSGSLWVCLAALLLLGVQSAFFAPAKFGVVPELLTDERLSQANGVLNMLSNVAVILGSLLAGPLSDILDPQPAAGLPAPAANPWLPGAALVAIALVGFVCALPMPAVPAANPRIVPRLNPLGAYFRSLAEMSGTLLSVMLAWSGFYMIAMMALLILPEYESILAISYTQTSWLLGVLAITVAVGSVTTGLVSGRRIRPRLIPCGALGMGCSFLLLGLLRPTYGVVATFIGIVGFSAGFYIIPLQALLQYLAPPSDRGRFLGTANAMSFLLASLGAASYWVLTGALGLNPHRVFVICGCLSLAGSVVGIAQLRRLLRSLERNRKAEPPVGSDSSSGGSLTASPAGDA